MGSLFSDDRAYPPRGSEISGHRNLAEQHWELIQTKLARELGQYGYMRWIKPLDVSFPSESEIILKIDNLALYQEVISECFEKIHSCKNDLGLGKIKIKVELAQEPESKKTPQQPEPLPEIAPDSNEGEEYRSDIQVFSNTLSKTPNLNPLYVFKHFVRGPSNQFAHASCLNVAENPGVNYNPLFIYGSTGLGKTHLLHAVGNHVLRLFPNRIVTYISSERFMNEMIYCIRHNKMWDFRQKYRHCDVFMMDDIQFISGNKAATQEEFFHTFNTLYEAKKQIIITSDLYPQDIPDIEERLRNRFQWGLIADIQPPDMEHRIAILMNKAEKLNVHLSNEVAEHIAIHAKRNVRELEGALHRIAAFAALQGRPLDKTVAIETFRSMLPESPSNLDIEVIQKLVAERFNVRVSDLKSKKRLRALSVPRQIAMYLSRTHTSCSFPEIGMKFGGKDHTTVMHAVKKIVAEKAKDADLKAHLDALERKLEQLQ